MLNVSFSPPTETENETTKQIKTPDHSRQRKKTTLKKKKVKTNKKIIKGRNTQLSLSPRRAGDRPSSFSVPRAARTLQQK